MEIIYNISQPHYKYFITADPKTWESCYSKASNYCYITSSIMKSFNSWILKFRSQSYCELVSNIRNLQIEKHSEKTRHILGSTIRSDEVRIRIKEFSTFC